MVYRKRCSLCVRKMSENESTPCLKQPIPPTTTKERLSYYQRSLLMNPSTPIRTNCNECSSCVRIRNILEYSPEATPLLASNVSLFSDARCYDRSLIALFVFILLFGSSLGIYLLFVETEGAVIEEFDFVSRETWGVNSTFLKDLPAMHTPISKVLLLELVTNCTDSTSHCLEYAEFNDDHKDKIKIFNGQVLYNFYQDRLGKIFEGRGWNFQSDCGQPDGCEDILTVGILEEPNTAPSNGQVKKLKAFLDYGITANTLNSCYEILVSHRSERYFDDLASTLAEMNRHHGYCTYYS